MNITKFGRALREARGSAGQTLKTMAAGLKVSPAFICGIESGRTKVPPDFIQNVEKFFKDLGRPFPDGELKKLAVVANESAPLSGLSKEHQMLVAGFACSNFSGEELEKIAHVLETIHSTRGKQIGK